MSRSNKKISIAPGADKVLPDIVALPVPITPAAAPAPRSSNPTVIEACRRKSERLTADKLADARLTKPLLSGSVAAPLAAATPVALSPSLLQPVAVTPMPTASSLKQSAPVAVVAPVSLSSMGPVA